MPFENQDLSITAPEGAGTGTPRVVIGSDIPEPLRSHDWGSGETVDTAIIWFGATDDTYVFLAWVEHPGVGRRVHFGGVGGGNLVTLVDDVPMGFGVSVDATTGIVQLSVRGATTYLRSSLLFEALAVTTVLRSIVEGQANPHFTLRHDGFALWTGGGSNTHFQIGTALTGDTQSLGWLNPANGIFRTILDSPANARIVLTNGANASETGRVLYGIRGTRLQSVSSAGSFTASISFGITLPSIPNVHVNVNSGSGSTGGWHGRGINITTTGFTLFGFGNVTSFTNVLFQWTAVCD